MLKTFRFVGLTLVLLLVFSGLLVAQNQIETYKQEAERFKAEGNLNQAAGYLSKVAYAYWDMNQSSQAVDYFLQAAQLNEQTGNIKAVMSIYTNIGMIYGDLKQNQNALTYYQKALPYSRRLGQHYVMSNLINIATEQENLKNYSQAAKNLKEALDYADAVKSIKYKRIITGMLAQVYEKAGDGAQAQKYNEEFLTYRKLEQDSKLQETEREAHERVREAEALTHLAESEKNRTAEELSAERIRLQQTEDSLSKIAKEKQLLDSLKTLKEREAEANAKIAREQEARAADASMISSLAIGVLVIVLAFGIFAFIAYRNKKRTSETLSKQNVEIQKQNSEIEIQRESLEQKQAELQIAFDQINKKNLDITNSINYAQRIQKAMLQGEDSLKRYLPESFIYLNPRDIVSGDFYWFRETISMSRITKFLTDPSATEEDAESVNFLITAVDCTGHGVPGAFMSMIGHNLLNEITNKGVKRPANLLSQLHRRVRRALRQETSENRDGMDMAMCVINQDDKTLSFAGAKNPLVYIQDGELTRIKGDRYPIGGIQKEDKRKFTDHIIQIDRPTTVYIFSDGYQDQFGGPKGRKFMKSNFHNLLLDIYQKPMEEQREILHQTIVEWMGDRHKQIDDILVVGFRLDFGSEDSKGDDLSFMESQNSKPDTPPQKEEADNT